MWSFVPADVRVHVCVRDERSGWEEEEEAGRMDGDGGLWWGVNTNGKGVEREVGAGGALHSPYLHLGARYGTLRKMGGDEMGNDQAPTSTKTDKSPGLLHVQCYRFQECSAVLFKIQVIRIVMGLPVGEKRESRHAPILGWLCNTARARPAACGARDFGPWLDGWDPGQDQPAGVAFSSLFGLPSTCLAPWCMRCIPRCPPRL